MEIDSGLSYGSDYHFLPVISIKSGAEDEVATGVWCKTIQIVNICCISNQDDWVLIDAGMPRSADQIIEACEARFGAGSKPKCIVLTHGHFDHVGAIIELVQLWKVPVYAHKLEMPYLTGAESYPAPDPSVEGGMVAKLSFVFPVEPIQLGDWIKELPEDGSVPFLEDWRWLHTPGHAPGHISLFREQDRVLIAGDAFVTVRQDSLYKVFTQEQEVHGPPRYLTTDWEQAKHSVYMLEQLQPAVAVTGHGVPMRGERLAQGLKKLATDFDSLAVPDYGKYIQ